MVPPARRTRPSRAERRDALLARMLPAVEARLAAGNRYGDITVEELIADAGVARSTFYMYFEDRAEVLQGLTRELMEELEEAAKAWWSLPTEQAPTREQFREAVRPLIDTYRPHARLMGAVIELAIHDARIRAAHEAVVESGTTSMADYLRRGQRGGAVRPELDPDRTARWLTLMSERGLHELIAGAEDDEIEQLLDAWVGILHPTLYPD